MDELSGINIVIADRDRRFTSAMKESLGALGATVRVVRGTPQAVDIMAREIGRLSALLVNVELMDESAEDFIAAYKRTNPGGRFYLLIDQGTSVTSSDPSGLIVDDYLQKPIDPKRLALMLKSGATRALAKVDPIVSRSRPYFQFRAESMKRALRDLGRIASSDQTVLVSGETGTGKEIISRTIHVMSPRRDGPFIALNCGAIPDGLIEGELFGHEKGAFTGALGTRRGKFETAHKGTLLLDEIGDMSLNLQVRLLRVLEEGHVYRVGGERPVPINVRVIAATRRDLKKAVQEGIFREDLYYRLNILRIHLPLLRERREDISFLAVHFMDRVFSELRAEPPYPKLSSAAITLLESCPWPGNVRELRNVMTRVATLLPQSAKQVLPMHITPHLEHADMGGDLSAPAEAHEGGIVIPEGSSMNKAERIMIQNALDKTAGNRTQAAKILGISIRTLRRKLNG